MTEADHTPHSLKYNIIQTSLTRTVIKLTGLLANSHANKATDQIIEHIKLIDSDTLAIEISEVTHIDSMGITLLIAIHEATKHKKIKLELQNPPTFVKKLLDLTKVTNLFKIID